MFLSPTATPLRRRTADGPSTYRRTPDIEVSGCYCARRDGVEDVVATAAVRHPLDVDAEDPDPVLVRRAKILRLTSAGQRFGYICFGLSMLLFFIGLALQFPAWLVTTIVALMVLGSVVLLPAIILSYAAKAADSEDRGEPFGY